eukprot:CAMPEP_0119361770 /NCGR_PEP_ID=MMETSP1334-20130426/9014_1 /TAXON_ID=127549 /ORGANISM="Calcidiscus leptoporus, Strain RCC1130" /LENGTH=63 /DNA_ID=CAMNT_0007376873 /DNA_START=790 /DNA_END=981 /DNA_ORIENTATION=+
MKLSAQRGEIPMPSTSRPCVYALKSFEISRRLVLLMWSAFSAASMAWTAADMAAISALLLFGK